MRYNITIHRTYETEIIVSAESLQEAEDWAQNNEDTINEEELEQCNIVETYVSIDQEPVQEPTQWCTIKEIEQ